MEGRMDEQIKYKCVFQPDKECPVRKQYKLQPESLVGYCTICHINPTNIQEPNLDIAISEMKLSYDFLFKSLEMYSQLPKDERQSFVDAFKLLSIKRTQ